MPHKPDLPRVPRLTRVLKMIMSFLLVDVFLLLVYCVLIEPRFVRITTHDVSVPNLPAAFDGFTIVQMTDTHLGTFVSPKSLRTQVDRVNALNPDLVLLTGDFVSVNKRAIPAIARVFSGLSAKHGVYAVLGNHDYWVDASAMTAALREGGIPVLFNESRKVSLGKEHVWLAGLDDLWEGSHDYDRAFDGIPPAAVCIAMAHNPDTISYVKNRSIALMVTGHTHGGLVSFPFVGPLFSVTKLSPKYSSGMFTFGNTRMFVCRGMGSGTPFRYRCPPEIAVFTLHRAGNTVSGMEPK
jgi:uncharacterized protein